MSELTVLIIKGYLMLFLLQTALWVRQVFTKNASSADVGWSVGMALLVLFFAFNIEGFWLRKLIVVSLLGIWSLRLSSHLIFRTISEGTEDSRYARFREGWKENANRNFFLVYQLQPIFNVILSVPFLFILSNTSTRISFVEWIGVAVWIAGLLGESISDRQLHLFKKNPDNEGKICQEGLWGYSRHPNFFFEWVMWIAYAVIALGSPNGLWGMIAPAFMLFLLMKVTGIPVIEKYALAKKGEAFKNYMKTTSFFVPLPKKNS
jgi:steroid 5-alpha reductase family enzyme